MRACCICNEQITSPLLNIHCGKIVCKLKSHAIQQEKLKTHIDAKETQYQNTKNQLIDSWALKHAISHSEIRVIEIPHVTQNCNPVNHQRILDFKHHLKHLLCTMDDIDSENKFEPQLKTDTKYSLDKTVSAMCSMCRGQCCMKGGDNYAFIQRSTLLRVINNKDSNIDSIEKNDVVNMYASHIPKISMDASCIYHTNAGCNLPKKLRADICSDYYCNAAHQFINSTKETTRPSYDVAIIRNEEHVTGVRAIANDGSFSEIK